ncbi:CheR family methyltransferase [Massilia yuzhufengensis]|uniref:Chemotaxis protein methyltransferase CheR n=1 Tax=Massilia yuzhufengensis TaxID=1164594 RepID=A0A1I1QFN1_9BURK|nr:CheR family methyltransferase [Massilia yuzhufengensis]SFD20875.1 chemotaxis protein methyltransferase CheR [Massilia yuzhufengensis]
MGESSAWTGFAAVQATEELEIELLLEALYQRFGVDFRGYGRTALRERLLAMLRARDLETISGLQERVLHEAGVAQDMVRALAVPKAELFDHPGDTRRLRIALGDSLRPTALPKVWLAEPAGVGEAWTLAILLAEEKLYARTEVFATLGSDELLLEARNASLPAEQLEQAQSRYAASGGGGRLADYFEVSGGEARLLPRLRERITWAQYSLVTDASFNEFHAIVCRRVLPDFGPLLRQRVLRLFRDSLSLFGVLGLDRELAPGDAAVEDYQHLFGEGGWYKRVR